MDEIMIRRANKSDNYELIASCIYLTDPFIYPAAFGANLKRAAYAISKLIAIEDCLFHPKNLILALCRDEICGVLLYNRNGAQWNEEKYTDLIRSAIPNVENFKYVSDLYFSQEASAPQEHHIEVMACCVMPRFRNMGIGEKMLNWMINEFPGYIFDLDVLANNSAAIRLYRKCGFHIVGEMKGFSLTEKLRPNCYRMSRECVSVKPNSD